MKNLKYITIVFLALLLFSCDTEEDPGKDRLIGSISADIGELNIVRFESDKNLTETTGRGDVDGHLESFSITALDKLGRLMILEVVNLYNGKEETFDFKDYDNGSYASLRFGSLATDDDSVWDVGDRGDTQKRGEISITYVSNDVIRGTFYANGYDQENGTTKKVRNGKFEIQLIR